MNRIGYAPNRIAAVIAAVLIAAAGIATVMAQALGPAGPSPAGDNAEVVAQAVFGLPEGDTVWRIRDVRVAESETELIYVYPSFVTTESVPVMVEVSQSGLRQRVAAGEATVIPPGMTTLIRSVGPRQTVLMIDVLPVADASLSGSSGTISSPFPMTAGAYDVDLIRIDLDEGETSTVPMGNGPSQLVARSGQAEIAAEDETFNMAAGSDRLAAGDLTITSNADNTVILVARIGPQVDMPVATPAATEPAATPAAATPPPATPDAATPAATPAVSPSPTPDVAGAIVEVLPSPTAAAPQDIDSDGDGLVNSAEIGAGTNPDVPDTDDDGVPDGQEVELGTDPLNSDTDGDVLYDGGELIYGSDPLNPDTDGDGLTDGDEVYFSTTSPILADTDGDGVNDFNEVTAGSNPLDPNSVPEAGMARGVGPSGGRH